MYMRMYRWAKSGVLDHVFKELQRTGVIPAEVGQVSLDSTSVKVHPHGCGAQKNGAQSIGRSRGGLTTKVHVIAVDDRRALAFSLSPGQARDAPEGRKLLEAARPAARSVAMDKACEDDETRAVAESLGLEPVVPPKSSRKRKWDFDKAKYRKRNEVERLIGRLKRYRKLFTRYDKLDVVFSFFIYLAIIVEALQ